MPGSTSIHPGVRFLPGAARSPVPAPFLLAALARTLTNDTRDRLRLRSLCTARVCLRYGDPGFRYTHHDVGHQISSLAFAAAAQNATVVLLDGLADSELDTLLRPDAPEDPVCLLAVFPSDAPAPASRNGEDDWWRTFEVGAAAPHTPCATT